MAWIYWDSLRSPQPTMLSSFVSTTTNTSDGAGSSRRPPYREARPYAINTVWPRYLAAYPAVKFGRVGSIQSDADIDLDIYPAVI